MTGLPSQSTTEEDGLSFREMLTSISGKLEDLSGRVQKIELTVEQRFLEREHLLKTDFNNRLIQESTERKINEAYNKAKLELYDNEIRTLRTSYETAQKKTDEQLKTMGDKIDKLEESVVSLQTKLTIMVGTIMVLAEVIIKVVPELLK